MSDILNNKGFATRLVHGDRLINRPQDGAVHQATNNSVLFDFPDIQDLVDIFQGKVPGHAYSRQSSGSIDALQNMLTALEGGVGTLTFASGMAAITTTFLALLQKGDHLIMSQFVFGNTNSFIGTMQRYGIEISVVDVTDMKNVEAALQDNTRAIYVETIANPVTQVADLLPIGDLCEQHDLVYMVDNTMTPACMFDAKAVKASLLMGSLTKYFAGHGQVLGGAVIDTGLYPWSKYPSIMEGFRQLPENMQGLMQIKKKGLRDMGGCLTSDSAHSISVGMETMTLRLERTCSNAMKLAQYLVQHPKIARVFYPGLENHPQHDKAKHYFSSFGGILSFDLKPEVDCFSFMNKMQLVLNATHLGDTRTLAIPVAHTIYFEMGAEIREKMGISDNMIRLSMGIEDIDDIIADFEQALA